VRGLRNQVLARLTVLRRLQLPTRGDWSGINIDVIPAQTERHASPQATGGERTMIPWHLPIAVTNIAGYVHIG
jgi:hypothetical protein